MVETNTQRGYPIGLKLISTGGGQLTADLAERLERMFKAEIINTYVSTEAGQMGLAYGDVLRQRRQKGNCFVPMNQVEIVNESNTHVQRGVEGGIRVRSKAMGWVFNGDMTESDAVKGDGWFYPGDVGYIDGDGLLIVSGRADEVINVGGVKFNPELLEDHLKRHPMISDIGVVRMPSERFGSEPWGAVVAKGPIDIDAINNWLDNILTGELAGARLDRLVIVQEIPKTGTGKIARKALRELLNDSAHKNEAPQS